MSVPRAGSKPAHDGAAPSPMHPASLRHPASAVAPAPRDTIAVDRAQLSDAAKAILARIDKFDPFEALRGGGTALSPSRGSAQSSPSKKMHKDKSSPEKVSVLPPTPHANGDVPPPPAHPPKSQFRPATVSCSSGPDDPIPRQSMWEAEDRRTAAAAVSVAASEQQTRGDADGPWLSSVVRVLSAQEQRVREENIAADDSGIVKDSKFDSPCRLYFSHLIEQCGAAASPTATGAVSSSN